MEKEEGGKREELGTKCLGVGIQVGRVKKDIRRASWPLREFLCWSTRGTRRLTEGVGLSTRNEEKQLIYLHSTARI